MADYGIVQTGFSRKHYNQILADMQSRARANFGETINTNTNKPFGKLLDIYAWALSEIWEEAEETYNCIAIDTASGVALDRIVKYKGLRRKTETTATSDDIRINGVSGTAIPIGFIVGKDDGTTYTNTESGEIPAEGFVVLPFVCNYSGSRGNADAETITTIITPITGITSVINTRQIVNGQDYETDSILRQRYIETVGGLSTVDSIRAAVANVEGVVSVLVIENPLTTEDSYGNPPKSFQVFVYGGTDEDVAQAILESKAGGIQAFGTTIVEAIDASGFPHDIGFTRVDTVMIEVQITVTRNQFWPYNGVELIKEKILEYIGGIGPEGKQYSGLKVAQSVVRSYISSLVWPIGGIVDAVVLIAKEGETVAEQNIAIGEFEIARTSFDLIEVILT